MRIVLLNKEYTEIEKVKQLLQRKPMLGIIAYKSEEHESYSVEYLILSSPTKQSDDSINIIVTMLNGTIMSGGMIFYKRQ